MPIPVQIQISPTSIKPEKCGKFVEDGRQQNRPLHLKVRATIVDS